MQTQGGPRLPRPALPPLPREETDKPAAQMDTAHSGGLPFFPERRLTAEGPFDLGSPPPHHNPGTREEVSARFAFAPHELCEVYSPACQAPSSAHRALMPGEFTINLRSLLPLTDLLSQAVSHLVS